MSFGNIIHTLLKITTGI